MLVLHRPVELADHALLGLWRQLEERGIFPERPQSNDEDAEDDEREYDLSKDDGDLDTQSSSHIATSGSRTTRALAEASALEIEDAIVSVLSTCPNHSCTVKSITSRVLKEFGIVARGSPRAAFERRVIRSVDSLGRRELVEKYKAKNQRIRLVLGSERSGASSTEHS